MNCCVFVLCVLSFAKGAPFHQSPMEVMTKQSSIGGYDQMAVQQAQGYQLIVGKLTEVLSKPEIVQILKDRRFQAFIEPSNLIKHVKGEEFKQIMNPEIVQQMMHSPIFSNVFSMPEVKRLIHNSGLDPFITRLPQILPLLMSVFRERIIARNPLPSPIEELGLHLGIIPPLTPPKNQQESAETIASPSAQAEKNENSSNTDDTDI